VFADKESLVFKTFAPVCTGILEVDVNDTDHHYGKVVMTLSGHQGPVNSIEYTSDGLFMCSGSSDGTVRVWDMRTSHEAIAPLHSGNGPVLSVAFSHDGKKLACGTETGAVCIWSLRAGQAFNQRPNPHSGPVMSVAFSPNDSILASASKDKTVHLWDVQGSSLLGVLRAHTGPVNAVSFSPDGFELVSASDDRSICLWNGVTGKLIRAPHGTADGPITSICFSPDGKKIVATCDADSNSASPFTICFWRRRTGKRIATWNDPSARAVSARYSPDGRSIWIAHGNQVRSWTLSRDVRHSGHPTTLEGHTAEVRCIILSPDNLYIASASDDHTIRVWKAEYQGAAVRSRENGHIYSVAVSSDGETIVSGGYDCLVHVSDAKTGEAKVAPLLGHTQWVFSVAISPDGHIIAAGGCDQSVRVWDPWTSQAVAEPLHVHRHNAETVAFSPNSRWLASGSTDRTVIIWEVETMLQWSFGKLQCDDNCVAAVAFAPDSQYLVAGSTGGQIYLWRMENGELFRQIHVGNGSTVESVCFSPDGTRVVSGGDDRVVRIWCVDTGEQISAFYGHTDEVQSVAYCPNGRYIASASQDKTLRLWDATTGALNSTWCGHSAGVWSVAFTPDGRSIASGSIDGTVRIWSVQGGLHNPSEPRSHTFPALDTVRFVDGWLTGPAGELLLWVPAAYREYLADAQCTLRIRPHMDDGFAINVGATGWHRGEDWTSCWKNDENTRISGI